MTKRPGGKAGPDVRAIRDRLKLSQGEFAARFGLSVATLRDWEQGRRHPDGPARGLLKVIEHDPEAVTRALAAPKSKRGANVSE